MMLVCYLYYCCLYLRTFNIINLQYNRHIWLVPSRPLYRGSTVRAWGQWPIKRTNMGNSSVLFVTQSTHDLSEWEFFLFAWYIVFSLFYTCFFCVILSLFARKILSLYERRDLIIVLLFHSKNYFSHARNRNLVYTVYLKNILTKIKTKPLLQNGTQILCLFGHKFDLS